MNPIKARTSQDKVREGKRRKAKEARGNGHQNKTNRKTKEEIVFLFYSVGRSASLLLFSSHSFLGLSPFPFQQQANGQEKWWEEWRGLRK